MNIFSLRNIFTAVVTGCLAIGLGLYLSSADTDVYGLAAAFASFSLFSGVMWQIALSRKIEPTYVNSDYLDTRHALPLVFMGIFIVAGFYVLLAFGISTHYPGENIFLAFVTDLMTDPDVRNYLHIAEFWYGAEQGAGSSAVFLPLYPILVKSLAVTGNYFFASLTVSGLSAGLAAVFLYRLVLLDADARTASRAVKFIYLFPAAFFFAMPVAESLSLLFSILFVYLLRKRFYTAAMIAGFCAALSDFYGVLLLAPAIMETAADYAKKCRAQPVIPYEAERSDLARQELYELFADNRPLWRRAAPYFLPVLGLLFGFGCFMYINYIYYGDWLHFTGLRYKYFEHVPGHFWDTAVYLVHQTNIWLASSPKIAHAISIPNLAIMFLMLCLMFVSANKIRRSYTVYGLLYFFVLFGIFGDLNAPRFALTLFTLPVAAAAITDNKFANLGLSAAYAAGFGLYFYAFVCA